MNGELSFGTLAAKHPSETIIVEFEWYALLAVFWRPGTQYLNNTFVRPPVHNGFSYKATADGQSGSIAPNWNTTLAGQTVDGSVTWETNAAGSNGVQAASSPVVTDDTGDLTIGTPTVAEGKASNTLVRVTVGGGKHGQTYRLRCQIGAGTQTLIGTLELPVSKLV